MGYEFGIQYKEGSTTKATSALSKKDEGELMTLIFDYALSGLLELSKAFWLTDPAL